MKKITLKKSSCYFSAYGLDKGFFKSDPELKHTNL